MNHEGSLHGFTRLKEQDSPETGSSAVYYIHEKSGAELVHLKNEDKHLAFSIGFKTPPADSTGVPHIVEHSVLSGSRKFKTREPFMELLKGSMNTFLNAMTYPDMTLYPVSSMNAKDFRNLVDVYMDAVLFPDIYEKKEIFLQEGWHYHILEKEDPITYTGVVYNEMRGAYSSQEANVSVQINQALNKGTTYEHESGGYPYAIPDLTYENFLAFHKTYYHPSNSLIYLYGDVDLDEMLKLMDKEYLSHFDRQERESGLSLEREQLQPNQLEFTYPADESLNDKEHAYLSYAVSFGRSDNIQEYFIHSILNEVLINSESSPLKKALNDRNLGEDVMSLSDDSYFMDFGIAVKHTSDERLDEFVEVVEGTLKEMAARGIDEKLLLGSLNRIEFQLREAGGSLKGIIYSIASMASWRYGADPLQNLSFNEVFTDLRRGMKDGLFEKTIREKILENPRKVLAVHRPEAGFFDRLDKEVEKKLADFKASLSDDQLSDLIEENQELLNFQMTEDSKEDKATIPHLEISDIDRKITHIEGEEVEFEGVPVLFQPFASSDISYFTASFSLADIKKEDIFWVNCLAAVLAITDTENYSYADLNNEINIYTSGIGFSGKVFKKKDDPVAYKTRFHVTSSAMGSYYSSMLELIEETLFRTTFQDSRRLKEVFMMLRSGMESGFDYRGHELVMRRVASFFSQSSRYQEELKGVAFFDRLNELLENFDEQAEEAKASLQRVAQAIFTKKDLTVAFTGEVERREELLKAARSFIESTPNGEETVPQEIQFDLQPRQEALTSSSGVPYVAKGSNLRDLGFEYTGKLTVLAQILSMDYLHNAIRARGGAYGAGISIEPSGNVSTYSYRDPNLESTLKTYDGMGEFLRTLPLDEDDVKNYIIGSMTRFDPPLASSAINSIVLARRFSGSTEADIEDRMNQAIETSREDLTGAADMMDELMAKNYLSVFGNEGKIRESKDLFSEIRPIRKKASARD